MQAVPVPNQSGTFRVNGFLIRKFMSSWQVFKETEGYLRGEFVNCVATKRRAIEIATS